MWLKLEFPFAGEAEKQESKGRGEEGWETNGSRFTQAKVLLAHLYELHSHFTLSGSFRVKARLVSRRAYTHTHKKK